MKKSDVLLVGKVIAQREICDTILTGFVIKSIVTSIAVEHLYKGALQQKNIEIISGVGQGDCGFNFEIGKDYVIYANYKKGISELGPHKYLYTDICKRTKLKDEYEIAEIDMLGRR